MEVSVQTDRRKKVELPQVSPVPLAEVEQQDQKQRERKIKKLTMINRELIDTLKRQNDELTRKINKQKLRVGRSVQRAEHTESPSRNLQKEKKELANAYKQIEMYKTVLKDLKAKEISTESIDKLNQLQNRIKFEDGAIDKLQKELKYVKGVKEQQEKELHVYENQDEELKKLKEKLKQSKRETKKREEYALKQHAYFMELEKTLRRHNDEYYPGVVSSVKTRKVDMSEQPEEIVTDKQWQAMRTQLAQLKKVHEENNRKIEQLTRLRNKEVKSSEENEERLKEKQRKLQAVRSKMAELSKLVGGDRQQRQTGNTRRNVQVEQSEQGRYEGTAPNGKSVSKSKNAANERQVKRWIVPQGYVQQRGKIMPDSTFFSDKSYLRSTRKSKIQKVQIWSNSEGVPAMFQFHYVAEDGRWIEGILAYSLGELQELEDRVIEFKEGDYLSKLQGRFDAGLLTGLTLVSKFGKKQVFNPTATGEEFKFEPRPNEIPTCMFGASVRDYNNSIRICHIGCEFIADW